MMRLSTLAMIGLLIACGGCEPTSTPGVVHQVLESEDPRFRILLDGPRTEPTSGTSSASSPQLYLRILPKPGWHIEPKAPTRLDLKLSADSDIETRSPIQTGEVEVSSSNESIEFAITYRIADASASSGAATSIDSHLTFGVCREGDLRCEIVNRDLRIPLNAP